MIPFPPGRPPLRVFRPAAPAPRPVYVPAAATAGGRLLVRDARTGRAVWTPSARSVRLGPQRYARGLLLERADGYALVEFAGGGRCWVAGGAVLVPAAPQ